jgi:putative restriction endonuclease
MELTKADDLFAISRGEEISKRNLFDLIQFSKVVGSSFWSGSESIIGNTPQQGINWIGVPPEVRAVIIKTRPGSYETDGWGGRSENFLSLLLQGEEGENLLHGNG